MPSHSKPFMALLAAAAVIALGGCGRRGDLEPPPDPSAVRSPESRNDLNVHRTNSKIVPPKKDFVLDPLLQ